MSVRALNFLGFVLVSLLPASPLYAVTVVTVGETTLTNQGTDEFGTPVGTNGTPVLGEAPATPTTVEITGVTDADAATVDFFSLQVDGTLISTAPFSAAFSGVTTGTELATATEGSPRNQA